MSDKKKTCFFIFRYSITRTEEIEKKIALQNQNKLEKWESLSSVPPKTPAVSFASDTKIIYVMLRE